MTFNLVEREKDSVLPRFDGVAKNFGRIALSDPLKSSTLQRITPTENILPILKEEQRQLYELRNKILDSDAVERADMSRTLPYIEHALDLLQQRTAQWCSKHAISKPCSSPIKLDTYDPELDIWDEFDDKVETDAVSKSDVKAQGGIAKSKLSALAAEWKPPVRREARSKTSYFYYQAPTGQNIFVHGINYRCMMHDRKGLDGIPVSITGKVLLTERFVLTSEARAKYKFLKHLPLTTEVIICYIDMHGLVSRATLNHHREPLQNMKKKRNKLKKAQKLEAERKRQHEKKIQDAPLLQQQSRDFIPDSEADISFYGNLDGDAFPTLVEAKLSDGEKSTPSGSPIIAGFKDVLQRGYAAQQWPSLPSAANFSSEELRTPEGATVHLGAAEFSGVQIGKPAW
eukprot:CAMPEP_0184487732 /NCGR_PEP_ID=MMETSP0113_2-20130426/10299_1 /TAXON_ID=91329 /ORGANISM="Norrisiella sphaerica, Strain BC52" /LENGTH=399 /DNA_ID=CAMNT_0026870127 /DNA_START=988 /DNA_END=2184 /DNA_ORIENTATION=+